MFLDLDPIQGLQKFINFTYFFRFSDFLQKSCFYETECWKCDFWACKVALLWLLSLSDSCIIVYFFFFFVTFLKILSNFFKLYNSHTWYSQEFATLLLLVRRFCIKKEATLVGSSLIVNNNLFQVYLLIALAGIQIACFSMHIFAEDLGASSVSDPGGRSVQSSSNALISL